MAISTPGAGRKGKRVSRETQYKKTKAAEAASRKKGLSSSASASTSSTYSKGKGKAREVEENPHPFRYKSFNDRLASVHINISNSLGRSGTGALSGLEGHGVLPVAGSSSRMQVDGEEEEDEDESDEDEDEEGRSSQLHAKTSFGIALLSWRELNLSLPFTLIMQQLQPLSLSLPMLLYHQATITRLLKEGLLANYRDSYLGYEPLLDLVPRLANDLGSSFLLSYPDLLAATFRNTTISKLNCEGEEDVAAMLVERAFESAAATLRCVAPFVLREQKSAEGVQKDWLQITWQIVRPYLGGEDRQLIHAVKEVSTSNDQADEAIESEEDIEEAPVSASIKPKKGKVPPHTHRFASEAFAHLLRSAKGDHLVKVAVVMIQDLQEELDNNSESAKLFASGIAGVWVEVAKSVDHRLHSSATSQLSALLLSGVEAQDDKTMEARILVGNFVVTALVHHSQAAHLVPLFNWLADIAEERMGKPSISTNGLIEITSWLSAFVGTRKGKRVDDSLKSRMFSILIKASELFQLTAEFSSSRAHKQIHGNIIQLVSLSLPLGRIQDLVGPGKKLIDQLAALGESNGITPAFVALATSLGQSSFEFTSFRQIVLPAVMTRTAEFLESEDVATRNEALSLLANLHQQGQFAHLASTTPTSTSTAWSKAVSEEVRSRLSRWCDALKYGHLEEDSVLASLSLGSLFPSNTAHFVDILCRSICTLSLVKDDTRSSFDSSPINQAGLLGITISSLVAILVPGNAKLSRTAHQHLNGSVDAMAIPLHFAWHRNVVCAFANLATTLHSKESTLLLPPLAQLATSLKDSLMASDETLRLSAARLLSMAEEQQKGAEEQSVLFRLVEIEETPLQVETVRERNVRMRAIAREVVRLNSSEKKGDLLDVCASTVISYLVSVLKLNLKPLWEESKKALVELSSIYGQEIWQTAFAELKEARGIARLPLSWSSAQLEKPSDDDALIESDEEGLDKQFLDPLLAERKQIVSDNLRYGSSRSTLRGLVESQRFGGRLDLINYHSLILGLFGSLSALAERNNAALMQHFFGTIVAREGEDLDEDTSDHVQDGLKLTMFQRRAQLCAYLETFAQFSNPKALYRSDDLHRYLYTLCSMGDNKIQGLALDVILRWKDPAQVTYSALLKKLMDPKTFREELTRLNLTQDGDTIQQSHRERLLPLLIRLFFGIMVSKRGRVSQGSGQMGRKNAILVALSELPAVELKPLVEVMLEPFEDQRRRTDDTIFAFTFRPPLASHGRQSGFLSLLGDVIKHLGLRMIPLWDPLIGVTLNLTLHASILASEGQGKATAINRSIRQSGLRRLDDFFKQPTTEFDWSPFMSSIFERLVSPRLSSLRMESIQSPSALLDLIHTWSNGSNTVFYLVEYDTSLLEHVFSCLTMPTVKPSVIARILDMVEAMLSYVEARDRETALADRVESIILRPYITVLLSGLTPLVRRCNATTGIEAKAMKKDDLMRRLLHILKGLSPYIATPGDASALLDAVSPMLRKNNAIIAEKSKVDLLLVYEKLLALVPEMQDPQSTAFAVQYKLFSGLLSRLRSRNARLALCKAFTKFAVADPSLSRVNQWILNLNSYDPKRMEEYDFEKRLKVFDTVNEGLVDTPITLQEWLPLLHNFLFNLQDVDELAIRANAGSAVRKYIDLVAGTEQAHRKPLVDLFTDIVYPGLRRGLRSKSDLVQRELVAILGHAVSHLGESMSFLREMAGLLVSGDEEASFFNNVYHIQVHRRIRALNRLGQEAEKGIFSSRLIVEIFLPLVDQFLNTEVHHGDANLINAAVECLGKLSMHLKWGPYNVLLWKFLSIGKKTKDGEKEKDKEKSDKVCVRAAMSILDHFHFNMEEVASVEADELEGEEEIDGEDVVVAKEQSEAIVEETKKVLGAVQNRLLPKLMDFLDQKDDLEDTVRLPIAVGVARVMLKLPQPLRRMEINKLLATLANVFKSKAQDTRDLARTTLGKVALSLGPEYLSAIVRELRRAFTRGPQKAVLAYTVHNVLVQCTTNVERPLTVLDVATANIVDVIMEDVFGQTSEDRESIENRTTYKEVKSTKSLDTLEQVAKIVDSTYVAQLLTPLRDLMHQTEAVKAVKSMDDCLRRISAGLNVNEHISSGDFLLLCHSLLTSNADFLQASRQQGRQQGQMQKKGRMGFAAVLRKRSEVEGNSKQDHYARNAHKFVAFGMDLLIHGLRRGRFDYSDAETLARLDPMINAVGNCLYAKQGVVIVAGLRALSMLVKCPVQSVQTSMPLIIKQTLKIVEKEGTNAQSDILMASLKLLTVVIRDTASARLHDRQVIQLVQLIDMNLDEDAELQGVIFGLLRAIVGGKYVLAEVYDVMDKVASMMVTNQSASIRDTCRSTYLTFLLEFPQGQTRFSNQMTFLSKNISYVFESGRLSLLEFLRIIFIKMQEEVLRDYLNLFFISLVMCLGNDESSKCKEKAAKLIVQILDLCRVEEREKLVNLAHIWAQSPQGEKRDLARIAMIIYGLFSETPSLRDDDTWKAKALSNARRVLALSADDLEQQEYDGDDFDGRDLGQDWQMPYQALQVVSKLYQGRQSDLDNDGETWQAIRNLLLFPHTWVRATSCRLLGQRLGQMEVQKPKGTEAQFGSMANMLRLTKKMSLMLQSDLLDEALALQIVKNLVFIGKCFALVKVAVRNGDEQEASDEDGDGVDVEDGDHDWSMENPLRWMFTKLSHQLRQCKLSSASVEPLSQLQPSSLLKWFAAMVNHLSAEQSRLFLTHIISPLYRILEAESHLSRNNEDENFAALQSLATQVQDLIQSKVGTNAYAMTYASIKQKAVEKRKKRKDEALMMAMKEPQKAMKRKAAVNQRKHESRKRKTQSYMANKERMRPLR